MAEEPKADRTEKRGKPPLSRVHYVAAALVIVVVLSVLVVMVVVARSRVDAAQKQLDHELSRIRAKAEPLTLAEIIPEPIPAGDNAAVLLERAFAKLNTSDAAIEDWEKCLDESFETHRRKAEKAVELNYDALTLARQALLRPRCQFDLDYTKGYGLELPHLGHLRDLARLFAAEALCSMHAGASGEAADSMRHVFLIARAITEEPPLISKVVQCNITAAGLDTLQSLLLHTRLTDGSIRQLLIDLRGLDFGRARRPAMLLERATALDTMMRTIEGKRPWPSAKEGDGSPARGFARAELLRDATRLIRLHSALVDAFRFPPWEARSRLKKPFSEIERCEGEMPFTDLLFPAVVGALNRLKVDSFAKTPASRIGGRRSAKGSEIRRPESPRRGLYERIKVVWARRDAAVLGLSCELYKSKHGRYPAELKDLAPEFLDKLPPDPFTGKPFVYRREGEGDAASFAVYSVGDNLKDDGGVDKPRPEKDDIAWEGRPPPALPEASQGAGAAESRKE